MLLMIIAILLLVISIGCLFIFNFKKLSKIIISSLIFIILLPFIVINTINFNERNKLNEIDKEPPFTLTESITICEFVSLKFNVNKDMYIEVSDGNNEIIFHNSINEYETYKCSSPYYKHTMKANDLFTFYQEEDMTNKITEYVKELFNKNPDIKEQFYNENRYLKITINLLSKELTY